MKNFITFSHTKVKNSIKFCFIESKLSYHSITAICMKCVNISGSHIF